MAKPGPGTQVPLRAFHPLVIELGVRTLEFQLHSALARPSRALRTRQDSSVSLAREAASGVADVTRALALAPGIARSLQQDLEGENGHREFIPKSALIAL